jgi:hypothetical protein
MVKMIEIRKVVKSYLKSIHPNVVIDGKSKKRIHHQSAPENAVYPYLVYDFPNSIDDGTLEQFVLDIDGWDNAIDTTVLENLMSSVDGNGSKSNPSGLHRKTVVVNNELSLTFYRENRLPLIDDDPRIKRRKYVYQIRTYQKEVL